MKPHHKKSGTKAGMINKGEMLEVVAALADRGLGGNTIADLTGYHPSTVKYYLRELGVAPMTQALRVERILAYVPDELKMRAASLKARSDLMDAQHKSRGLHGALSGALTRRWGSDVADDTSAAEGRIGGV